MTNHQSISRIVRRSLFTWLLLPSLAIVLVVGLTLTLWMRAQLMDSSARDVEMLSRHASSYLNDASYDLSILATRLRQTDQARHESILADFLTVSPEFSRLLLVGQDGRITASAPAGSRGHDFALEFDRAADRNQLITRPYFSPSTGRLAVALGLHEPSGGLVVCELNLEQLQKHIQGIQPGHDGRIVLTDAYGTLISHPDNRAVEQQENLGGLAPLRESGPTARTVLYRDQQGLRLATTLRLEESGWVVFSSTSVSAVLVPIVRSTGLLLLMMAGMLALVSLRTRQVLERRVVAPLEQFTCDIAKVAEGNYAAVGAVTPYASSELAQAEQSFIHMARTVRARESELRESEARFRQVVENVREAFWIREIATDRILYASPAFQSIFGVRPEELEQSPKGGVELVLEQDRPRVHEAYQRLYHTGAPMDEEYRILRPGGSLRWIRAKAFPVHDGDGSFSRTVGIADDITEAKRHRLALEALVLGAGSATGSKFFYSLTSTLAQALDTPHAIVTEFLEDQPGRARSLAFWINDSHCENFEYDLAGTPSEEVRSLGLLRHESGLRERFPSDAFLAQMNANAYMGMALTDAAGQAIGHLAVLTPDRLPEERTSLSIMSAFSARAGAELERLRVERAIGRSLSEKEIMLKEIHHRVKNNLQVISSLLSLQMLQVEDEGFQEMLRESCDRIRSIALVHEELYRFSDLAHIDVSAYVATLSKRLAENHLRPGVEIVRDVEPASLPVNSAVPLGLILNEMLTNAYKHAFPDGRQGAISVFFREGPEQFLLSVSDDGAGLPPDFRIEQVESLGMQLIHNLTLQLRGSLSIGAGPDGRGSAFTVRFPKTA